MAYRLYIVALGSMFLSLVAMHIRLPATASPPPTLSTSHATITTTIPVSNPTPPPVPAIINQPSPLTDFYEEEMHNIFGALLDANNFTIWGKYLAGHSTRPNLPDEATLFVPVNNAVLFLRDITNIDPNLIPSHIIPQRLSFKQLESFQTFSTFPTLLPHKILLVTTSSPLKFTIDNATITHPDIYLSSVFAVHGVEHMFQACP